MSLSSARRACRETPPSLVLEEEHPALDEEKGMRLSLVVVVWSSFLGVMDWKAKTFRF